MEGSIDTLIAAAPDPAQAARRLEHMREDRRIRAQIDRLDAAALRRFIAVISYSSVLFHFLCRHPEVIHTAQDAPWYRSGDTPSADLEALRRLKYQELYRIACLDFAAEGGYESVLEALTGLAEQVVREAWRHVLEPAAHEKFLRSLCAIAMGKLGAGELNFSSDLDLIFVSDNHDNQGSGIESFQKQLIDAVRGFARALELQTDGGFLYRIDLNLRPWGRSGPLFMAIDDTEHYYEASSDAWERFAWLRARPVAGALIVGDDLLQRLRPFIYLRWLSTQDLERFVEIKNEMAVARRRAGHWNVKTGAGGIRDIEFFVQTVQIVNAARHTALRTTSTLRALAGLRDAGLLDPGECGQIAQSYLYLRRLENHLQMVAEQQTHELPDERAQRLIVARSLAPADMAADEVLDHFEAQLLQVRTLARSCFDRILPADGTA